MEERRKFLVSLAGVLASQLPVEHITKLINNKISKVTAYWTVTIKRASGIEKIQFADPKFIGKSYICHDGELILARDSSSQDKH